MVTSAIRRRPAPLHQERPSLVAALVHSGDLIRIVDTDGVIVYASDSAERLLGYRPNELVGMRMSQLHHPD